MAQMKEQIKTPERDLNKMEISNLSDAEFKTLAIRVFKEISEDLNSSIKMTQPEMKDTLIKIKNNLYGNNSRVDEAEMKSVIWNIRKQEITNQNNKKKKESKRNEDHISSLWDNSKCSNIHIIGVPEGKEKGQEIGNLFEKNDERKLP